MFFNKFYFKKVKGFGKSCHSVVEHQNDYYQRFIISLALSDCFDIRMLQR